ncbi:MAG: aldehyde dehydrogenase family protein, partial [Candidatus Binatia bacterium]
MTKLLIGGEQVESGSKETYEVRNPATGEVVDQAAKGTAKDVMQAIDAAETAFKEWSDVTAEDRGKMLTNACELIKEKSKEI